MKRAMIALAMVSMATLAMTSEASAATGPGYSCLGTDLSSGARFGSPGPVVEFDAGSGFGQFNAYLAQTYDGMAGPILTHMAGRIPDSYIDNSCNDESSSAASGSGAG